MSVVGIDLGNLNTVVAVARNRGIDVIVNETSNRATPSLVSFGAKQRYLGEAAKTQEVSNFKNTVASLKRIIGRPFSDPELLSVEKKFVNAALVEAEEPKGSTAASVYFQDDQRSFSFTQLAAMFLVQVKDFTSAELKIPVSDCVISCPTWFTDHQRRATLDAASIAGLNCVKLMNDTTAAALGYGITKTDLPEAETKPRIVTFVDLGHSSYQVAVVSFVKGKLVVKGTAWDRNLGGRDFDEVLVSHYIKEFDQKYKMDIRSSAKAVFRLRQGAEKVKKILSANAMTMLNVECLLDDKDVSATVKRSDFEELAAPLAQRLLGPLKEALDNAGVTPADVDYVELVGGSTRIPLVKDAIARFFGGSLDGENKLSTTLNQDEAVARGCALQCAIISPVFKVRDFSLQEWNGYPVELRWDASQAPPSTSRNSDEKPVTSMEAFPVGNPAPSTKILTVLRALKDEELSANNGQVSLTIDGHYMPAAASRQFPNGIGSSIGQWVINGIKKLPSCEVKDANGNVVSAKATIKVKAKLDAHGIVGIDAASQVEELIVPVEAPAKADTAKKEGESTEAQPKDDADATATSHTSKDGKTKKVIKKHDLAVTSLLPGGANAELLAKWVAAEGDMHASDRLVIDTAERRNALEEYVYETRSKLEMAWSDFILDDDRTKFMKKLSETEDWLYGEGEEATKSVYAEKLVELKKIGDPVAFRYHQCEERPIAEKQFREYVNSVIISVQAEDERYAHIAKEELEKVGKHCQEKLNWLNEKIGKQNEMPKHAEPCVTSESIVKERDALQYFVMPILNKPKPIPKKEEAAPPAADAVKEATEGDDGMKTDGAEAKDVPKAAEEMEVD